MSGHDELVLIPEEEIDISDISENESSVQNTETINDHSVEMVGYFIRDFEPKFFAFPLAVTFGSSSLQLVLSIDQSNFLANKGASINLITRSRVKGSLVT